MAASHNEIDQPILQRKVVNSSALRERHSFVPIVKKSQFTQ